MLLFLFPTISKVSRLISCSLSVLHNCRNTTVHIRSSLNKNIHTMKITTLGGHIFSHGQVPALFRHPQCCARLFEVRTRCTGHCVHFSTKILFDIPGWTILRAMKQGGGDVASTKGKKVCNWDKLQHRKEEATPYPQIYTSGLGDHAAEEWLLSHIYQGRSRGMLVPHT